MIRTLRNGILGISIAAGVMLVSFALRAQTASSTTTTSTAATTDTTATTKDVQDSLEEILEEPESADTYRYDPQGRRDPFRSLIGPTPKIDAGNRPEGLPGFLIDEL